MSVVTFLAYLMDKRRAVGGTWRIRESMLHLLELGGGWPGALVAQQVLRHKSSKGRYLLVFWAIVALHGVLWAWWLGWIAIGGR